MGLFNMTPCFLKKKKQQTKKTRERENASKTQATVLYYLVLEVTSITFAVFMFIRSETLSPPLFQGEGITQGHDFQEEGNISSHFRRLILTEILPVCHMFNS